MGDRHSGHYERIDPVLSQKATSRWIKAQKAERSFWEGPGSLDKVRRLDDWSLRAALLHGVTADSLKGRSVLEVGAGPNGIIYYLTGTSFTTVAVEPLDLRGLIEGWKRGIVCRAVGEKLPFRDAVFDFVLCINVLDHVVNPSDFLMEIHRVLRDDGKVLLDLHVLRGSLFFFRRVLNSLDPPHPHHMTKTKILRMFDDFALKKEFRYDPAKVGQLIAPKSPGLAAKEGNEKHPPKTLNSNIREVMGNFFMETWAFTLQKV